MNTQTLVKEPKEDGLKKHSTAVHKLLEELVKIGKIILLRMILVKVKVMR